MDFKASLKDGLYCTLLVMFGMWVADSYGSEIEGYEAWLAPSMNWHLGAEYDNIARAIFAGKGFANPFEADSGPTAWMPPVLPYVLASLYWLTDFQPTAVMELILGLKAIALIFTGMTVLHESRRLAITAWGYAVWPIAMLANFYELFQITHDLWLLLTVVNVLWLSGNYLSPMSTMMRSVGWGAFGGFAALCSPVVGFAFILLTLTIYLRQIRNNRKDYGERSADAIKVHRSNPTQCLFVAAVASLLMVTPWTVRNRVAFGKWIPIKSNSGYELWQSQCLDDDGVLDRDLTSEHPYASDGIQRQLYVRLGETEYLREKSAAALDCIATKPSGFLERIGHRTLAALIWYYPYSQQSLERVWPLRLKRVVYPLAFISVLLYGFCSRCKGLQFVGFQFLSATIVYLAVLAPYILVSYGDRYAAPLLAVKCILVLHLISFLARRNKL